MMNASRSRNKALLAILYLFWFSAIPVHAHEPLKIQYGCAIDAQEQIRESQALAKSVASPEDAGWRAKGDLHRKYRFPAADADMPYRL